MGAIGRAAREASLALNVASAEQKNQALGAAAAALRARRQEILAANARDMQEAVEKGLSPALLDRLMLDERRVDAMAGGLGGHRASRRPHRDGACAMDAPQWHGNPAFARPARPSSASFMKAGRTSPPMRAHCALKSSNAVILRGGSESANSNAAIHAGLDAGLKIANLPASCIQLVPTTDRAAVGYMLAEMVNDIDVIVPRGGKNLIARVQREARVPVIGHLEGVCHVYVDRGADCKWPKTSYERQACAAPAVCGSAETLLVDGACASHALGRAPSPCCWTQDVKCAATRARCASMSA